MDDDLNIDEYLEEVIGRIEAVGELKVVIEWLKKLKCKYEDYYPKEALGAGLREIERDRYFKKPKPLTEEHPVKYGAEVMPRLWKLLWKERILRRFALYALVKAASEIIRDSFPPQDGKYNNSLVEFCIRTIAFQPVLADPKMFATITVNSRDNTKAKSRNIPLSLNDFHPSFLKAARTMQPQHKAKHFDFLNMDTEELQKVLFQGITEDFDISKVHMKGQSKRYKLQLLMRLFLLTHTKRFFQLASNEMMYKDRRNLEVLSKIIG